MRTDYLIIHNDDLEYTGEIIYGIPVKYWSVQGTEQRILTEASVRIASARLYEENHRNDSL